MRKINHRELEQCIGQSGRCSDNLKLKVAGYYSQYNDIVVAARRGLDDGFFLVARGPKTDISDAHLLSGRYLVIGDIDINNTPFFSRCTVNSLDAWYQLIGDESPLIVRLLIAGAIRVVVTNDILTEPISRTFEFIRAKADGRLLIA